MERVYEASLNVLPNSLIMALVCNFMDKKAEQRPYPKYLYRAHVHGHPYPRLLDDFSGEYTNSFGSDFHLWSEYDARSQIFVPMSDPIEIWSVDGIFSELELHLKKTNVNNQPEHDGEGLFLSNLVSLSGDFRWAAHRICEVGRKIDQDQDQDQIPGLAIFESSKIDPSVVRVWRVADMITFLDTKLVNSSVKISPELRSWVANAEEFVCWLFVPREALIAFTPLPQLAEAFNGEEEGFLTKNFVNSKHLGEFSRRPLVHLSLGEYADRASNFVRNIITNAYFFEEAKQLAMRMEGLLLNPYEWGYDVPGFTEDVEEAIPLTVDKALEMAYMERWVGDPRS